MQTFLWWANVCVRVHDDYEAFFPPDVTYVADHAKRAMSTFPVARRPLLRRGLRLAASARGRPALVPQHPGAHLVHGHGHASKDFFGGYDHAAGEGYVHWADHTISPGKKLWTWGNHEFGYAWDRELTDADGPYVELMAGVFTDNQPDFSFLLPGEVRTFSQYWYPLVGTGPGTRGQPRRRRPPRARAETASASAWPSTRALRGRHRAPERALTARSSSARVDLAPERPLVADEPWPARRRRA